MTDLTEQLYAGTLPTGHYYFNNGVETYIVLYKNINSKHLILQEPEGLTVISGVPSYEEWKASEKYNKHLEEVIKIYERKEKQHTDDAIAYNELLDENTKLKERVSKLEKMQYSYTPEEWNTMLRTVNRTKELLKECELWFTGIVGNMNDKNVGEHNRNLPIGNFESMFKNFSQKINQALGEDNDNSNLR